MPDSKTPELNQNSDRVQSAIKKHEQLLMERLKAINSDASQPVLLRSFKKEKILEVWKKVKSADRYILFQRYPVCAASGHLGPKLKEGDKQVPEGFYHIQVFNPKSRFHLSLGINYPNDVDRYYCDPEHPGGEIYIHGGCASIGCLAMTNAYIEEIYVLCHWAKENGQDRIPVYILPFDPSRTDINTLSNSYRAELVAKWMELLAINRWFELYKKPPKIECTDKGRYKINPQPIP